MGSKNSCAEARGKEGTRTANRWPARHAPQCSRAAAAGTGVMCGESLAVASKNPDSTSNALLEAAGITALPKAVEWTALLLVCFGMIIRAAGQEARPCLLPRSPVGATQRPHLSPPARPPAAMHRAKCVIAPLLRAALKAPQPAHYRHTPCASLLRQDPFVPMRFCCVEVSNRVRG